MADPAEAIESAPSNAAVGLRLRGIGKSYGARRVLRDLHLDIAPGEFVAIVGRSGCGKSTLLRIAAGLEVADEGHVSIGADDDDRVRIMFQDARLLPWKTVVDNVALGLRPLGTRSVERQALDVLEQVGLVERSDDWPAILSGGQRQRVALARALVHRPGLMLFDEPLGALDALTRIEMQRLIEAIWQERCFSALLVTHDVEEAVTLADRVVLIENGVVALDLPIDLPRPRHRGDPAVAAIEGRILERVLGARGAIVAGVPGHRPVPFGGSILERAARHVGG